MIRAMKERYRGTAPKQEPRTLPWKVSEDCRVSNSIRNRKEGWAIGGPGCSLGRNGREVGIWAKTNPGGIQFG